MASFFGQQNMWYSCTARLRELTSVISKQRSEHAKFNPQTQEANGLQGQTSTWRSPPVRIMIYHIYHNSQYISMQILPMIIVKLTLPFRKNYLLITEFPNLFGIIDTNVHTIQCTAQMILPFGFIPITSLQEYHGPPVYWQTIPDMLKAHQIITESGLPNFMKCRIPIQTRLKPQVCENIWPTTGMGKL